MTLPFPSAASERDDWVTLGEVNTPFNVKVQGVDVCFDPNSGHQMLVFKMALNVGLPQLLKQLLDIQKGAFSNPFEHSSSDITGSLLTAANILNMPDAGEHMRGNGFIGQDGVPPSVAPAAQAVINNVVALAGRPAAAKPSVSMPLDIPPAAVTTESIMTQGSMGDGYMNVSGPVLRDVGMEAWLAPIRTGDVATLRQLTSQRADVNISDAAGLTPLHNAFVHGGDVDVVNVLLRGRAEVNKTALNNQSPLHIAIQAESVEPISVRMLLCHQADLYATDQGGTSPIDAIRATYGGISAQSLERAVCTRKILDEVVGRPTVDVIVLDDNRRACRAQFADTVGDHLVFHTESSIGIYSMMQRRVTFMKTLKQQQATSGVKYISANPDTGTIAACLELGNPNASDGQRHQNVFIIWPKGKMQDSEPLKLSIKVNTAVQPARSAGFPECPMVLLSRGFGTQYLLGHVADGNVWSWCIDVDRVQLVSESPLASADAVLVSASDDGIWIGIISITPSGTHRFTVWSYMSDTGIQTSPAKIIDDPNAFSAMALQASADDPLTVTFATAAYTREVGTPEPIEVWSASLDGVVKALYRLNVPSVVDIVRFGHWTAGYVFSIHGDGCVVLYDLERGTTVQGLGNPGSASATLSPDLRLMACTEQHCVRIFRFAPPSLG